MEVTLAAFQKRYQYKAPSDLIGKGGFSDVYKAWDTQDEQFVALKIATASADEKYDLTNEVKKIKKLKHPNLIEYYDLYEVSTGTKDIHGHNLNYQVAVMEYADGGTLGDLLKNKPLTHTEAEELAEGIIDGLAYLHANNITHRDLKPANILLTTKDGKRITKITDFGLAKNTTAGNTASTMLVGTVEYMAPEFFKQAEGETTTAAADVWSIGVILLEALTGIHPFGKTTQGKNNEQIIYNILSANFNPSLQNLRAPFKELITRCLIREPKLRPQSAEELKGVMLRVGDAFAERTQIISTKQKILKAETGKSKWQRLITALFDFDVRNGKWRNVLAREFLLALGLPILIGLLHIAFMIPLYFVTKPIVEKRIETIWSISEQEFGINSETRSPDGYKFSLYWVYSNLSKRDNISLENLHALFLTDYLDIEHFGNLIDFITSQHGYIIDSIFGFAFLPAIFLYPIRFSRLILLWAFGTLGFSTTERTSKAIKYSLLILFLFCLSGFIIYLFYSLKKNTELVQSTNYITKTVSTVDLLEKYRIKPAVDPASPPAKLPSTKEKFTPNEFEAIDPNFSESKSVKPIINKKKSSLTFMVITKKWFVYYKNDPNRYDYVAVSEVIKIKNLTFEKEYKIKEDASHHSCYGRAEIFPTTEIHKYPSFEEAALFRDGELLGLFNCKLPYSQSSVDDLLRME